MPVVHRLMRPLALPSLRVEEKLFDLDDKNAAWTALERSVS